MKSNWYGSVNKSYKAQTIHGCAGFRDLLSKSFVVTTPFDLSISVNKNEYNEGYSINSDYPDTSLSLRGSQYLSMHGGEQLGNLCAEKDMSVFKIALPMALECKDNIDFMMSPNIWRDNGLFEDITYTSGLINFKYQNLLNIFFMLRHKENEIHIPYSSPVVLMTPLTDRDVIFKHSYNPEKYDMFSSERGTKYRAYFKNKTLIDKRTNLN